MTNKVQQVTREDFTRDTPCPCCGEKSLDRIEVDIGVGTECSPWSCFNCGADPFTARLMRERMEAEIARLREALEEAYAAVSKEQENQLREIMRRLRANEISENYAYGRSVAILLEPKGL